MWQIDKLTDMQSVVFAQAQSPWITGQMRPPPELPGWVQSHHHMFSLC